jgi:hypothetical protein
MSESVGNEATREYWLGIIEKICSLVGARVLPLQPTNCRLSLTIIIALVTNSKYPDVLAIAVLVF